MKRVLISILSVLAVISCGSKKVKLPISLPYARAGEEPVLVCRSIAEAESKIVDYYFKDNDFDEFDYYIFDEAVNAFPEEAMSYDFNQIKELTSIEIFDTDDGNVRVYSWVYPPHGTMGSYGSILQYKWHGKVKFGTFIHDLDEFEHSTNGLYTLEDGKYIRYEYFREWSSQAYALAKAYQLTEDGLQAIPLFETKDGLSEMIDLEYNIPDWYFRAGKGEGYKWLFFYDNSKKTLYYPSSPEYNVLSDRYVPYVWDGETMHPDQEVGNPFLHSSLQDYEYLAQLGWTSRNLIRVDKMADDTYRYAAWPISSEMNDSPELVVFGGTRDESGKWVFKNQDVVYKVSESDLSVIKAGKEIAHWKFEYRP